jgi:hypothetical protein
VVVLNNTYIVSPSTVLTVRYGRNIFNDDNNLPFDFDAHTLGFNKAFADAIRVQKFPTFTTNVNAANFAQVTTLGNYSRLAQITLRFSY